MASGAPVAPQMRVHRIHSPFWSSVVSPDSIGGGGWVSCPFLPFAVEGGPVLVGCCVCCSFRRVSCSCRWGPVAAVFLSAPASLICWVGGGVGGGGCSWGLVCLFICSFFVPSTLATMLLVRRIFSLGKKI